jgi:hypothetical protein
MFVEDIMDLWALTAQVAVPTTCFQPADMAVNPNVALGYIACGNPNADITSMRVVFWNSNATDTSSIVFTALNKGFGIAQRLAVNLQANIVYLSTDIGVLHYEYSATVC